MRRTLLTLLAPAVVLVGMAQMDMKWPGPFVPTAVGTFSLVQHPTYTACTTESTTCAVSLTQTTAAGNLLVFIGRDQDVTDGVSAPPVSINKGGTLVNAPSCYSLYGTFVAYVLPSTSTAATSPITMTFASSTEAWIQFYEFHPSAAGASVGFDNCNSIGSLASSTSIVGPAFTWSGTHDVEVQYVFSPSGYTASGITPCNDTHSYNATYGWAECSTPSNGNASTWTLGTADTAVPAAAAFGWNVTPGLDQNFTDFEQCTNGSAPTMACLNSSTHGWRGMNWVVSNVVNMVGDTAASMPLLNATGRLNGDGSNNAAGQGSLGVSITGNGTAEDDYIEAQVSYGGVPGMMTSSAVLVFKYNENFVATDQSDIDCGSIIGVGGSDYAGANCYGDGTSRFIALEAGSGQSSHINFPGGTASGNCPCTIVVSYNGGSGNNHSLSLYNSSGSQIGSTVTEPAQSTLYYPQFYDVGQYNNVSALTSGKKAMWDSVQFSLNSTVPSK